MFTQKEEEKLSSHLFKSCDRIRYSFKNDLIAICGALIGHDGLHTSLLLLRLLLLLLLLDVGAALFRLVVFFVGIACHLREVHRLFRFPIFTCKDYE